MRMLDTPRLAPALLEAPALPRPLWTSLLIAPNSASSVEICAQR